MKWQMHKIVLLAIIVSTVFFSMLVYYVTYPFLFKIRRSFFQILLVSVRKTYERIIAHSYYNRWISTTYIVYRVQKNVATIFDTKRLQKYLFLSFEKENKYIYCRLQKLRHLQLDYFVRKLSCQKGCFKHFQMKKWMRLFFMKNIIKTIEIR